MGALTRLIGCITLACILIVIPILFGILLISKEFSFAAFAFIGVVAEEVGLICLLYQMGDVKDDQR